VSIFDSYKKKKLLNDGIELLNQEKYEDSIECFDKALELDPNYENAWYNKGYTLCNIGNYLEADECFDKFLEINPESVDASNVMVFKTIVLFMLKKYQEELELSNSLIDISKNSFEKLNALNIKSSALLKLEQYDESEIIIDKILGEDPESELALANKATILFKQGCYKESIEYYEYSLEIYNKKISDFNSKKLKGYMVLPEKILDYVLTEIWVNKGKAHKKLQETTKALECFNIALKLDPNYNEAQKEIEDTVLHN
jgi:tetratricopeptide (TPR) repeat protein